MCLRIQTKVHFTIIWQSHLMQTSGTYQSATFVGWCTLWKRKFTRTSFDECYCFFFFFFFSSCMHLTETFHLSIVKWKLVLLSFVDIQFDRILDIRDVSRNFWEMWRLNDMISLLDSGSIGPGSRPRLVIVLYFCQKTLG